MKYKLIACDLDETLLKTDRTISQKDRDAIAQAVKQGVYFVPATGRGYMSVENTLQDLGLKGLDDQYVISYNGGAISENSTHDLLHFQGLDFDLAQQLYQRGLDYDVCIHVYTKDMVYAYRFWQEEIDYLSGRMEVQEIFTDNLDFLKGQEIVKVLYVNTDYDYLRPIEQDVQDLTDGIDVSYSSNRYIEFNARGVSKGTGLRRLAEHLGIDIRETIAIGDNFNDLSMIQEAGLGVGVANTIENMKPLCDVITKATCNQSAVSEVIHTYVLNSPE